ncbi:unnamed protein product [Meloidogyne enterolobii]|uniref:Uncharacterized protein n=1 Tax=Meloidogyne enterolobii TaxID=390850 RepID=A0ACB1ALU2_MELEN
MQIFFISNVFNEQRLQNACAADVFCIYLFKDDNHIFDGSLSLFRSFLSL